MVDVSQVRKNWRPAPGGGNESLVSCVKCDKSRSYPVVTCPKCRRHYVLYLVGDGRCPYCVPESLAGVPEERKADLTPPEVKRLDK